MTDIVERLKSNEPLPICPFDSKSPSYWKMPDDKPCPFCGQENTTEGPDKCRGGDTRLFADAADEIERLRTQNAALEEALQWYVDNDDTNEGGDWDRVSAFWREGRTRAIALLTAPMNGGK